MESGERWKVKENDIASVILHNIRCEGRDTRTCIENC
jgi:hypothetical protein